MISEPNLRGGGEVSCRHSAGLWQVIDPGQTRVKPGSDPSETRVNTGGKPEQWLGKTGSIT